MNQNRSAGAINETLLELIVGIAAFGAVCQAVIVWFVSDRAAFSTGLWLGALLAVFAAVHMYRSLDRGLALGEGAAAMIRRSSIVRYLVITVVLAVVMLTRVTNPLAVFLGLMGLKVAAYIQPFTHRFIGTKKEKE